MGTYDVHHTEITCPWCHETHRVELQFRFGHCDLNVGAAASLSPDGSAKTKGEGQGEGGGEGSAFGGWAC